MRLFVLTAIFITAQVQACPNLTGTYAECNSSTGQARGTARDLVISQEQIDGLTIYFQEYKEELTGKWKLSQIIADGKTYSRNLLNQETGVTYDYTVTAHCNSNVLNITTTTSAHGTSLEKLEMQLSKTGSRLIQKIRIHDNHQLIEDNLICE